MFLHMNNVIGWFGDCRDDGDFHKDLATILQLWRCSAIWIMSMQIQVPARLQQCRPSGTSPRRALCQLRSRGGQLHHQLLTEATTPSATMQLHHQLLKKLAELSAATSYMPSVNSSNTIGYCQPHHHCQLCHNACPPVGWVPNICQSISPWGRNRYDSYCIDWVE